MSDIQLPATQQLTQALNQLSKLAPQSEAARLGIEVIVKHLAGSILNLSSPGSGQIRELTLPAKNLQGQLQNAGTYTVKVAAQQNPVLQFFSSDSPAEPIKIPITQQQLQAILKFPANQILNLASTQLQVSSVPSKADMPLQLNAKVESVVNSQLLIKIAGQTKALPIQLPRAIAAQFRSNDSVQIELSPKGPKWQLRITSLPGLNANSGHAVTNKGLQQPLPLNNQLDTPRDGTAQKAGIARPRTHSVTILPEQAPALLKAALAVSNKGTTPSVQLPVQTVLTQLPIKQGENDASLLNKLGQLSSENVTLKASSAGQFELIGSHTKPIAQLPISRDILSILTRVKTPQTVTQVAGENGKLVAPSIAQAKAATAHASPELQTPKPVEKPTSVVNSATTTAKSIAQITLATSAAPVTSSSTASLKTAIGLTNIRQSTANIPSDPSLNKLTENVPNTAVSRQKIVVPPVSADKTQFSTNRTTVENAPTIVETQTNSERLIKTPEFTASAPSRGDQVKLIHTLLRVVNARAELPAETLNRIQLAVTDPLLSKESAFKELIEPLVKQIKQAVPQGKENDALQIRQLLSAPALNLSSVQLVAPPASQGLLGGLVAILQVSLASRLLRNQPAQLDSITQTLGSLIAGTNKAPSNAQAARGLADFFQVEQKHQLLKEIGRLLSGHQANKLSSAEQAIQGQETFYYTLPSAYDDKLKNIELLIRRESESQQEEAPSNAETKSWHLTMKLGVGELGELLTKAKLRPDNLEIDFYASNDATKEQVFNFLPLLKKRLQSLGIEVAKSKCQLGKIPSTLQQRPYQVFETKV